jgi:hypothetical protein
MEFLRIDVTYLLEVNYLQVIVVLFPSSFLTFTYIDKYSVCLQYYNAAARQIIPTKRVQEPPISTFLY